jgi:hypothetical protein
MDQKAKETAAGGTKEPYIKPDFRYERVFAVAALQCGKVNSTQLSCHQILKAS